MKCILNSMLEYQRSSFYIENNYNVYRAEGQKHKGRYHSLRAFKQKGNHLRETLISPLGQTTKRF